VTADAVAARMRRAALVLGAGAVAAGVFALFDAVQYRLVRLAGPGLVVLLLLGALAIGASRLADRRAIAGAGAGFVVAAVLQFAQLGRASNWLEGDGSTVSLFLGLGTGLLVLGLTPVPADAGTTDAGTTDGETTGRTTRAA
jgi:hypothetical protein